MGVINEKIIALLTIEINADIIDLIEDDYGFVWEFGVHRDYRGNGYGKKLTDVTKLIVELLELIKTAE